MDMKSFIGGCLGGFAGIVSSYPFDTIKVRIQNQHISNQKYRGAIDCLLKTVKKESAGALYKGLTSPLVGSMFINAVLFGVEENVRRRLFDGVSVTGSSGNNYKLYAVSGAIAGLTQSFMLSPVELIKIKMQTQNTTYANTWTCARDVLKHNGARTLMRGTLLTVLRDVPGVSSYFISFEYLCNAYRVPRDQLSVSNLLMAGGLAGCFSWIITYPIDVIKTRYQIDLTYSNARDCLQKSLKSEGYMVLWRGLAPTLLRAFPNNAAVFATVTIFNRLLENNSSKCNSDENREFWSAKPSQMQTEFLMDTYEMHR